MTINGTKNSPVFLIVDPHTVDDIDFLQILNPPIHCLQVHSAADCLATVMRKNVSIVLIDENLPDLSGLKLVTLLKKMKPDIEIIFTTDCHDPQIEINARLAGILFYAPKPLDWNLVKDIIHRTLLNKKLKAVSSQI